MKWIDGDTHISSVWTGNRISADLLIEQMDRIGISQSLVWLHPNQREDEPCDFEAQNHYVYESSRRFPDRLLPVGWVNPRVYGFNKTHEQIRRQTGEYGFQGIKMNGAQNFYDLLDPVISLPVIESIASQGAFLAFHSDANSNTHPDKIAWIAGLYPEVKILLVHMGQTACQDAIRAAEQNDNIWLIGSGMPDPSPVLSAVKTLGSKRVCFGSDAPFSDAETAVANYRSLLQGKINAEEMADVAGKNLLRFFGQV